MPTAARRDERVRLKVLRRVNILDTTLRDGQQTPGMTSWSIWKKYKMAKLIDRLGVSVIEAGSPFASENDIRLIKMLTNKRSKIKAKICALSRPREDDIRKVLESGAHRINFFVPCSRVQATAMHLDLHKTAANTLRAVKFALEHGLEVEVTMMDAARADSAFLTAFAKQLDKRGAHILTLSDTVGSLDPEQTRRLFNRISKCVKARLSIHVHNDRDFATVNSLEAVKAGASQIHVSVASLGERAGNASLERIAIASPDFLDRRTGVRLDSLVPTIRRIARIGGFEIPASSPIIGSRVFTHSSGIHAGANESDSGQRAFEPFNPRRVGTDPTHLYGAMSGKRAIQQVATDANIPLTPVQLQKAVDIVRRQGSDGELTKDQVIGVLRKLAA